MSSKGKPRFLVIRFPPGAAGRFLGAMLMGSDDIAHFEPSVTTIDEKLNYVKSCFRKDLDEWLKYEPSDKMAWGINFVSNKYPRGDDLTIEQFVSLAESECTAWFHQSVRNNKRIIVFWHKPYVPEFFRGECISILVDKESVRWYHRSRWRKHYGIKDEKIHLKENDPDCHRYPINEMVARFENPILSDESVMKFIRDNVINSQQSKPFYMNNTLAATDRDIQIKLSDLLHEDRFLNTITMLCDKMNLSIINQQYLIEGFRHWRNIHDY